MELVIAIAANIVLGLLLAGLLARAARRSPGRLQGSEEALRIYTAQFPEATGTAIVSEDGQTALIALPQAKVIGLVGRHGHRWNAREISPHDLISVALTADTIRLSLSDFGWPRACIRIPDQRARADWLSRLTLLRSANA